MSAKVFYSLYGKNMQFLASLIWGASPAPAPPLPRVAHTHAVQLNELMLVKANLRPVETRETPQTFPSRLPYIREMAALGEAYRRQQALLAERNFKCPPPPPNSPIDRRQNHSPGISP